MTPDLSVSFAGIQLKNPVIGASGTFGYGVEFEDVVHLDRLGGFVVKGLSKEPMIGKLSPNVTSIGQMAHIAQEAGADAVSLVNTFVAMAIDIKTRTPRIANVSSGLSGPAIKPIAVRMVYEASKSVQIPVIGMGGISTAADVIEFMLAGATAVQVGTASYWDPRATEKIAAELGRWCAENEVSRIAELTGAMVA